MPVTWQAPLTWTNEPATGTITATEGQLITWSGGGPDSWVIVVGTSNAPAVALNVTFYCAGLASDGQLMIPPYVLDAMPAGVGSLFIENETQPQTFTAKGIGYGYSTTGLISYENVTYDLVASTPPAESPFNGTYTGTYSGTETSNGKAFSGTVTAVIDNAVLTVTNPGTGTGTVSSTGQITFGVGVAQGVTCNFSGDDVITGTAATASGTFTCPSPECLRNLDCDSPVAARRAGAQSSALLPCSTPFSRTFAMPSARCAPLPDSPPSRFSRWRWASAPTPPSSA